MNKTFPCHRNITPIFVRWHASFRFNLLNSGHGWYRPCYGHDGHRCSWSIGSSNCHGRCTGICCVQLGRLGLEVSFKVGKNEVEQWNQNNSRFGSVNNWEKLLTYWTGMVYEQNNSFFVLGFPNEVRVVSTCAHLVCYCSLKILIRCQQVLRIILGNWHLCTMDAFQSRIRMHCLCLNSFLVVIVVMRTRFCYASSYITNSLQSIISCKHDQ